MNQNQVEFIHWQEVRQYLPLRMIKEKRVEVHPLVGVVMGDKWAGVTRCREQQGLKWTMDKVKTVYSRRPQESVKALKKRTRVDQRDTLLHVVDKRAPGKSKCSKVHLPLCVHSTSSTVCPQYILHCVSAVHPPLCVHCTSPTVCPLYILHCVSTVHPPLCVHSTSSTVCPLYIPHCVSTVHPPLCVHCTSPTVCPLYILHCVSTVHPPLCVHCTSSTVCPLYILHCVSTVHPPLCVHCTSPTVCPLYILHCVSTVHPPLCVHCTSPTVCPLYIPHCVSTVHPPLCVHCTYSTVCPLYILHCMYVFTCVVCMFKGFPVVMMMPQGSHQQPHTGHHGNSTTLQTQHPITKHDTPQVHTHLMHTDCSCALEAYSSPATRGSFSNAKQLSAVEV